MNPTPHRTNATRNQVVESYDWQTLIYAAYSLDLTPSDYPLSIWHALSEQRFIGTLKIARLVCNFFLRSIHKWAWEIVSLAMEITLKIKFALNFLKQTCFFFKKNAGFRGIDLYMMCRLSTSLNSTYDVSDFEPIWLEIFLSWFWTTLPLDLRGTFSLEAFS